jgi:hypothetical protein
MPSKSHIHTYRRIKGDKRRMMCIDPDCSHTKPIAELWGKRSRCPRCREPWIMEATDLRWVLPTCPSCRNSEKGKRLKGQKKALQYLEDKMAGILLEKPPKFEKTGSLLETIETVEPPTQPVEPIEDIPFQLVQPADTLVDSAVVQDISDVILDSDEFNFTLPSEEEKEIKENG